MIYTITLNPSIDYYVYLDELKKGHINRIDNYRFIAAGKGINVSRMLSKLKINSVCIFPKGGFSGNFLLDELSKDQNIECRTVEVDQPNRINVKIRHEEETDLNASGPQLDLATQQKLVRLVEDVSEGEFVVISGSIQQGLYPVVKQIADYIKSKKAKLLLDVPNLSLQEIISCHPALIKPNLEELQTLLDSQKDINELVSEIKSRILAQGVESLLISMSDKGAYYIDNEVQYQISTEKVEVVNTVAAGDSLVAATVGKLACGYEKKQALRYGVAAGTAAVLVEYLPNETDIQKIYEKINIEEIQ
ncbi:MAG: 1-phosphofructokinase family hexose kinase [Erysipelotrichaceae bacterium]